MVLLNIAAIGIYLCCKFFKFPVTTFLWSISVAYSFLYSFIWFGYFSLYVKDMITHWLLIVEYKIWEFAYLRQQTIKVKGGLRSVPILARVYKSWMWYIFNDKRNNWYEFSYDGRISSCKVKNTTHLQYSCLSNWNKM